MFHVNCQQKWRKTILFKLTTECLGDTEQPLVVTCNTTEICILLDLIQGQESQQESPDPVQQ